MARYYADNGLKRNDPLYRFVGFDHLDGEVTEASQAGVIGKPMPFNFSKAFAVMEPGQTITTEAGGRLTRIH